jgi:hypothetical protein
MRSGEDRADRAGVCKHPLDLGVTEIHPPSSSWEVEDRFRTAPCTCICLTMLVDEQIGLCQTQQYGDTASRQEGA